MGFLSLRLRAICYFELDNNPKLDFLVFKSLHCAGSVFKRLNLSSKKIDNSLFLKRLLKKTYLENSLKMKENVFNDEYASFTHYALYASPRFETIIFKELFLRSMRIAKQCIKSVFKIKINNSVSMKYGIEELSLNSGTNKGQVSLPIASISDIKL
jgi:hypothetical protein